jgi:hypothetical protein
MQARTAGFTVGRQLPIWLSQQPQGAEVLQPDSQSKQLSSDASEKRDTFSGGSHRIARRGTPDTYRKHNASRVGMLMSS